MQGGLTDHERAYVCTWLNSFGLKPAMIQFCFRSTFLWEPVDLHHKKQAKWLIGPKIFLPQQSYNSNFTNTDVCDSRYSCCPYVGAMATNPPAQACGSLYTGIFWVPLRFL